jgi:hypothetical protein
MEETRMMRNLRRMREMGVTDLEANWILGRLSGTAEMTTALDALEQDRAGRVSAS